MKKFSVVLLLTALVATTVSAAVFRADISGLQKEGRVKLTPGKAEGMTIARQVWLKAEQEYTINACSETLPAGQWSDCTINFTADDSGTLRVELKGQWHRDAAAREWLKIGPVTVNGKALPNADYSVTDPKNGKSMPRGFWLNKAAVLLPGGGPDGKGAVLVNHDNTLVFFAEGRSRQKLHDCRKGDAGRSSGCEVTASGGRPLRILGLRFRAEPLFLHFF